VAVGGPIDPSLLPSFSLAARGRIGQEEEERSALRAGLRSAWGQISGGLPLGVETALGTLTPEREATYRARQQRGAAAAADLLPGGPMGIDQVENVGDLGTLIKENLLYSTPQMAAAIAGGAVGGLKRGPRGALAGAVVAGTPFFTGANVGRATNEGADPLTPDAAARSLLVAPAQAASDALVGRYLPGVGKFLGDVASTQTGGFAARTLKSIGKAGVTEAVTETGQQAGERFAAGLALTNPEAGREYVRAFGTAFFVGGAMGSLGGIRKPIEVSGPNAGNDELTQVIDEQLGTTPPAAEPVQTEMNFSPPVNAFPPGFQPDLFGNSYEELEAVRRPLKDVPDTELQAALKAAVTADPETATAIQTELDYRVNNSATETTPLSEVAGAAQRELDVSGGSDQVSGAPASATFNINEITKGVSTRKAYAGATTLDEVRAINLARLEAGSTAKGDLLMAERLGIDLNAPASAMATEAPGAEGSAGPVEVELFRGSKDGSPGSFYTADRTIAEQYAGTNGQVATEKVAFDNLLAAPTWMDAKERLGLPRSATMPELIEAARAAGHDGMTFTTSTNGQEYVRLTPEPAAPANQGGGDTSADTGALTRWKELTRGSKDEVVKEVKKRNPKSLMELQRSLYSAIASNGPSGEYQGTRVEELAREFGIVGDDGRLTEAGMEIARTDPIPEETVKTTARAQGLKGSAITAFKRGAQAHVTGAAMPNWRNPIDRDAFDAGKAWAEEFNSVPRISSNFWTEREMRTQFRGGNQNPEELARMIVPPEVQQAQTANRAVDATRAAFATPDDDIAQLKRLVREGDLDGAMQGLQRVQSGQRLFEQPGRTEPNYAGEIVTRGAPRAKIGATLVPTRASTRAEAEAAIRKYELSRAIDSALERGEIDSKQRMRLVGQLRQGRFTEVANAVPVEFGQGAAPAASMSQRMARRAALVADLQEMLREVEIDNEVQELTVDDRGVLRRPEMKMTRRSFLTGVAAIAASTSVPVRATLQFTPASKTLIAILDEGSPTAALQHIKTHSTSPSYRMIAAKLLRGDWSKVSLSMRPNSDEVRGLATLNDDGSTSLEFFGTDGLNEQTVLHEMIHAFVQQRWAGISLYIDGNRAILKDTKNRGDAAVRRFQDLWRSIGDALQNTNPGLVDNEVWANQAVGHPDEMLSWVLVNPDAQAYLKSVDVEGNRLRQAKTESEKTLWDKVVEFFAELFGLNGAARTALDEILSAGYAVLDAGAQVKTGDFNVKMAQAIVEQRESRPMLKSAQAFNNVVGGAIKDSAQQVSETINADGARGVARKASLFFATVHDIVEHFGQWFNRGDVNGAKEYQAALGTKHAIVARMSQMLTDVRDEFERLRKSDGKSANAILQLMTMTEYGINPTLAWEDQRTEVKDNIHLKPVHAKVHKIYNDKVLRKGGVARIYGQLRATNDVLLLSQMSVKLHQMVAGDTLTEGKIAEFADNPMDKFLEAQAREKDIDPLISRKFWANELASQLNALEAHLATMGYMALPKADKTRSRIDPLIAEASRIKRAITSLDQTPYFHLGRFGDYFVGWQLARNDDKSIDRVKLAKVAERLADKGFQGIISPNTGVGRVYMRVENLSQQAALYSELEALQREDLIPKRSVGEDGKVQKAIVSGKRSEDHIREGMADDYFDRVIQDVRESGIDSEAMARAVETLRAIKLDLMPENSLSLVMTQREDVPGFSPDMMRAFDWRAQVGINALAGMVTAPKVARAFTDMRLQLKEAEGESRERFPLTQRAGMRQVVDELSRREKERPLWPQTKILDQLRAVNHAWFLGGSVAYGLVNLTQIPALVLPELGAKYGFVKSSKAIASAAKIASKIMFEVGRGGYAISLDRSMDAVITHDALRAAGISGDLAEFVMRVANTGNLDIGGPSRELMRAAEGRGDGKLDRALRYASSIGYYTETMSRLTTIIAQRQLDPNMPIKDAAEGAGRLLRETMWDYSQTNQGRAFGKSGMFGPVTPLLTAFMQFTAQLTGKLYRETYEAVKGDSAESRAEARRFLGGHLAMMTFLAGSLGLPMATALAAAYDRLVDAFDEDDEPTNIRADYRNFLSEIFGDDAAELLTHGAFRGIGIDVHGRIGEQDIIPFSRTWADRRAFGDSLKDLQSRAWGAPTNAAFAFLEGGSKLFDGDLTGALIKMMPKAFADAGKAYQMTEKGFIDGNGTPLPIEPSVSDHLVQLLGFAPAEKAREREKDADHTTRKGALMRSAKNLRDQMVNALIEQDVDKQRDLAREIAEFDRTHPRFAVMPDIEAALKRRLKSEAVSKATGLPLGADPKDPRSYELTRYGTD
jgi:hypothetical protein